jgi:hypothetical protein
MSGCVNLIRKGRVKLVPFPLSKGIPDVALREMCFPPVVFPAECSYLCKREESVKDRIMGYGWTSKLIIIA